MAEPVELPSYKTILNPTDGSPASELATGHAIYLAKLSGARLLCVYIVDEALARRAGANIRRAMEDMRRKGESVLARVLEKARESGVAVEPMILEGQTGPRILQVASEQNVDLIVMGSTAYSDLERLLARGVSISEEVLKGAPCPVLIARG